MKTLKKQVKLLQRAFIQAIEKHQLIKDKDKILVGLSGGLDSMTLLHLLANYRKFGKVNFSITAVHINILNLPYSVDRDYLESFTKNLDVKFIWYEELINIDKQKVKKNLCFICSWNRRRILFQLAEKLQMNKVALGHHRDDALETLLMNMIFHSSISSLPAKLRMFDGNLYLIRPLIYAKKSAIIDYAIYFGIKDTVKTCPYANKTQRRQAISKVLNAVSAVHPNALDNMFNSMSKVFIDYLPDGPQAVKRDQKAIETK